MIFALSDISCWSNECRYPVIFSLSQENDFAVIFACVYHIICCAIRVLACSAKSLIVIFVGNDDSDKIKLMSSFFHAPTILWIICVLSSVSGAILRNVGGILNDKASNDTVCIASSVHQARMSAQQETNHRRILFWNHGCIECLDDKYIKKRKRDTNNKASKETRHVLFWCKWLCSLRLIIHERHISYH